MPGTVSTPAQEIAAALAEVESLNPQTVLIPVGGTSYPCSLGTALSSSKLQEGGWGSDADLHIIIRYAVLNTPPVLHSKCVQNGKTYRIDGITSDPLGAYFVMACIDPTRGV